MDPYFTEGAKWSDYILPCTSRFEYDEPFGNVKAGYSQIVIQEKVIDPLFEAHTDLVVDAHFRCGGSPVLRHRPRAKCRGVAVVGLTHVVRV